MAFAAYKEQAVTFKAAGRVCSATFSPTLAAFSVIMYRQFVGVRLPGEIFAGECPEG